MKRFNATVICSLLALGIVWSTSCARAPAEWSEASVAGHEYKVYFQMPQPFKESDGWVKFYKDGRTSFVKGGFAPPGDADPMFQGQNFERGYVTEGDDEHKFQVRMMENNTGAWDYKGLNRRAILELGLNRDKETSADKILDRQDFTDPLWPDVVSPAEELSIESADGKTIRHSRIVIVTRGDFQCYVLLTATRPKGEPRSPDVDKFLNSIRICTGDERPGRC
jgi:hypothetical protein